MLKRIKQKLKRINIIIAVSSIMAILAAIFLLPNFVFAVDAGLEYGEETELGVVDPRVIATRIIRVALGFLGIIAVALMMYAGWLWMLSEGNEEKITKAKNVLKGAIIGLIIILSSFAIATFILNKLTGEGGGGAGVSQSGGGAGGGIAALGSGIIESHYPARDQKDIPRNTKIMLTFKEAMDASAIIADANSSGVYGDCVLDSCDTINTDNILIYKTVDGIDGPFITDVKAMVDETNKTFILKPTQYLGSPSEEIWYTVVLSTNIKKANSDDAFPGIMGNVGYDWSFEVSTFIDLTPPQVKSIIPRPDSTEPRNVIIQVNFNEAVDPIAASGATANGFNNIVITNNTENNTVLGNFYISNQYKTVEFLTEDACGINSCGQTIYCLPGNKNLSSLVKAATLMTTGEPTANFPYDGVVDMADNSLDGNKDGLAQGPSGQSGQPPYNENNPNPLDQGDDHIWSFNTNDAIDITGPEITSIKPNINENNISLDIVPEITFNKLLMSSSLTTDNIIIFSDQALNYWLSKSNSAASTTVYINHDQFIEETDYSPETYSGIRDIYQNCYSPCSGISCTGGPSCCQGIPSAGSSCQ